MPVFSDEIHPPLEIMDGMRHVLCGINLEHDYLDFPQ